MATELDTWNDLLRLLGRNPKQWPKLQQFYEELQHELHPTMIHAECLRANLRLCTVCRAVLCARSRDLKADFATSMSMACTHCDGLHQPDEKS